MAAYVGMPSLGWVAYVEIPIDEALASFWEARSRLEHVSMLVLALAIFIGIAAARWLIRPIGPLRLATRRVAAGDYEAGPLAIKSGDELEDLGNDFDMMARSLRQSVIDLQAEAQREEKSRSELEAVLNATSEAMVFISPEGRFLRINQQAIDMLGLVADEFIGRTREETWPQTQRRFADPEGFRAEMEKANADPELHFRHFVQQIWPERRDLELFSTPVNASDGRHLGRLSVYRDVTEERGVDRMKSEFVALVSHELRTPMTVIKGYVDLLLDGELGEMSAQQHHSLSIVKNSTERLVALINNLLDLSRIEAGGIPLQLEPVDLRQTIADAAQAFQPLIAGKAQNLVVDLPEDTPLVLADPDRVVEIVTNLLSNANKYTPEGGSIWVTARPVGALLQVDVRDTGIGMTSEDMQHVFTRFFRANNRGTQEVSGTGLGLAITRALLEMLGGELSVESTPGVGSTFSFTLPITLAIPEVAAPLELRSEPETRDLAVVMMTVNPGALEARLREADGWLTAALIRKPSSADELARAMRGRGLGAKPPTEIAGSGALPSTEIQSP